MRYFVVAPMMVLLFIATMSVTSIQIFGQQGSFSAPQNIDATYAVSIVPGAAEKENRYHYYPQDIAVPTGTDVAWFNNDFGQPHTVTSGKPGAPDEGSVFNSGVMPATANSFFQFTFTKPGEYLYHCNIHPWRLASVTASNAFFTGNGFKIDIGSGATWNITDHIRVLLDIEPQTIPLDRASPIGYNVTISDGQNNKTVISRLLTTPGDSLPLELISSQDNQTILYGPDFSSDGAYHIQSNFTKGSSYPINIEIESISGKPVENPISVLFPFKTS